VLRNKADNLLAEFIKIYNVNNLNSSIMENLTNTMSQLASDERFICGNISDVSYQLAVKADQILHSLDAGKIITDLSQVDDIFRSGFKITTSDLSPLINADHILRLHEDEILSVPEESTFGSPRSDTTVKAK